VLACRLERFLLVLLAYGSDQLAQGLFAKVTYRYAIGLRGPRWNYQVAWTRTASLLTDAITQMRVCRKSFNFLLLVVHIGTALFPNFFNARSQRFSPRRLLLLE